MAVVEVALLELLDMVPFLCDGDEEKRLTEAIVDSIGQPTITPAELVEKARK